MMSSEANSKDSTAMFKNSSLFKKSDNNEDVARITEAITLAFASDPTWGPVLAPSEDLTESRAYWGFFVNSAARYPWSYTSDGGSAVSVWYPPGAQELTEAELDVFPDFAKDLLGSKRSTELFKILEQFDKATPEGDYFYLSLLAVHPNFKGAGLGMKLLKNNLSELDGLGAASYLESSNPLNNAKYEQLGYQKHGNILLPSGVNLTTYWREPGV